MTYRRRILLELNNIEQVQNAPLISAEDRIKNCRKKLKNLTHENVINYYVDKKEELLQIDDLRLSPADNYSYIMYSLLSEEESKHDIDTLFLAGEILKYIAVDVHRFNAQDKIKKLLEKEHVHPKIKEMLV